MLKLYEQSKRSPYGGHQYPEYGITFRGESFKEVVEKVRTFRVNNNIPVGDPEQDVLQFYARHWPWLVKTTDKEEIAFDEDYVKWREWIHKTWRNPPLKIITTKEAKDRWEVCSKCPMNRNKGWAETDESSELTRRAFLLRRGIDVPEYLGFCACHASDLGAMSFIQNAKDFSSSKDGAKPEACWV